MRGHAGRLLGQERGLAGGDSPRDESGVVQPGDQLGGASLQHEQQDTHELQNQEETLPPSPHQAPLHHPPPRSSLVQKAGQ